MKQNSLETIDPKLDAEYNRRIASGISLGTNALPYLPVRGFYGIIDAVAKKDAPEEMKATATLMLSLPNSLAMVRGEPGDVSVCSAMHSAMGEIIDSAYGTSYTKTALLRSCMRFCSNNALLSDGEEAAKLEEQLSADLTGVWSEHSWENLLLAAGVQVERANRGEDLGGTDLWVQLPDESAWISVDVKAQPSTVARHAQNKGKTIKEDYTIPANDNSAVDFDLYIAANSDHRSAYVAFNNPPASGNIAPIDFRGRLQAIEAAKQAVDTLWYYAENGLVKKYQMMVTNTGSVHFVPIKQKATT